MDNLPSKFSEVKLVDGTFMKNVVTTRAAGFDVRLFVTDGKTFAPIDSVVWMKK